MWNITCELTRRPKWQERLSAIASFLLIHSTAAHAFALPPTPAYTKSNNHQVIGRPLLLSLPSPSRSGASMSIEHEPEVRDVLRQILGEMKQINGRLESIESRQKQIEESIATLAVNEDLQKMVTQQTATQIQAQ
ncbi:hypothetical protein KC340_g5486 [Hortaea werneckii]|nr:hypothetical protein KC342_g5484 [Hortaea werneckii]KAI7100649.1 hypothetical protein KC339_g7326 [Hortaea werneckii]KAI7229861.1 hypothetical protein KC365_g7863 [Hortaea werneckii]KAI7327709.1 hypothetical protein KC340_g5486 [Hortaea werneckii]KAI7396632.1 hypothetical protein KC328_g5255 [Hortaea werneckii]